MRLDNRISRLMTESDLTVEEAQRALDLMFLAEEWRRTRDQLPPKPR